MPPDPTPLQDALARTAETYGPGLVALVTDHGVLTADTPFVTAALAGG